MMKTGGPSTGHPHEQPIPSPVAISGNGGGRGRGPVGASFSPHTRSANVGKRRLDRALMRRAARILAPVTWMALLWMLSSIPAAADKTMAGIYIPKALQKLMHVVAYAVLAVTWLWVFDAGRLTRRAAILAVCLASTYAVIDEVHQTFVSGRTGSVLDVGLDTFAAVLGVLVVAAARGAVTSSKAASGG